VSQTERMIIKLIRAELEGAPRSARPRLLGVIRAIESGSYLEPERAPGTVLAPVVSICSELP
jgi:hypothetical protein